MMKREQFTVTHGARGDWRIEASSFQATLPMMLGEPDAWIEAGQPTIPAIVPERIEAFIHDVISGGLKVTGRGPKAQKYERTDFTPLDGEERVYVIALEKRSIRYGEPGEVVAGRVICTSPRCKGWERVAVQFPGSTYDRGAKWEGERIEGMSPGQVRDEHVSWHEKTFGVDSRVQLDRWIERNKALAFPELTEAQRIEHVAGLSVARTERKACK